MGYTTYHQALDEAQAEAEQEMGLQDYNSWDETVAGSNLANNDPKRGAYQIAPGLTMAKLYGIIHERLSYVIVQIPEGGNSAIRAKLDECTDIDAVCQNIVWVEVEKALGIHPNTGKLTADEKYPDGSLGPWTAPPAK